MKNQRTVEINKNTINMPVIALRNITVVPGMVIHFDISRKKSIKAAQCAMDSLDGRQRVFLITQNNPESTEPTLGDLYSVGTIAEIKQVVKLPGKILRLQVEGIEKAVISELENAGDMLYARLIIQERMKTEDQLTNKAIVVALREILKRFAVMNPGVSKDVISRWLEMRDAVKLMESFIADFPMEYYERQKLLEISDAEELYAQIAAFLLDEIDICMIRDELANKVKNKVDQSQKEYYLREQLHVINEELNGDVSNEIDEYEEKISKLNANEEVKAKLNKELKRLKNLTGSASEANVERSYIETCISLPWNNSSIDNKDIKRAEEILEEDHYGMKDVKERIIEYLAVRNITEKGKAPILCLVGPPGTGKTSVAKSVARALDKKYVRICLGGVRDEAEIRGHRKTYVGAMPGRIIEGIRNAGTNNPLMLLDEIDKISNDHRSDTASALLEVLDSEQNSKFVDHYIEIPVDLSDVLFIATANDLSTLSKPLLDRMEIIELHTYTNNEKMHIAKEHLIEKQIKANGLLKKDIKINDKALNNIINLYTREAGVRNLERQISKICRKAVSMLYKEGVFLKDGKRTDKKVCIRVNEKNLEEFLGKPKYRPDKKNSKSDVGIVRGLAWTSAGGDTLEIEVNTMAGKGELKLTGNMGDVMKESAMIALSYVRSVTEKGKYKVDEEYYEKHNFHLHIPEGAIPKDGPSAGVTMATAFLSAVTGIPVKADIAMTGEINLRGKVLAIGGLKEKVLAAKAAGITHICVPDENKQDVCEFDDEVVNGLEFIYAKTMSDVLNAALDA